MCICICAVVSLLVNSRRACNHIGPVSGQFDINLDIILEDKCPSDAHIVPLPGKQTHFWHLGHIT